jgi:hypothetical protein
MPQNWHRFQWHPRTTLSKRLPASLGGRMINPSGARMLSFSSRRETRKYRLSSGKARRSVLPWVPSPICLGSVSPSPEVKEELSQPAKRCQRPFRMKSPGTNLRGNPGQRQQAWPQPEKHRDSSLSSPWSSGIAGFTALHSDERPSTKVYRSRVVLSSAEIRDSYLIGGGNCG